MYVHQIQAKNICANCISYETFYRLLTGLNIKLNLAKNKELLFSVSQAQKYSALNSLDRHCSSHFAIFFYFVFNDCSKKLLIFKDIRV